MSKSQKKDFELQPTVSGLYDAHISAPYPYSATSPPVHNVRLQSPSLPMPKKNPFVKDFEFYEYEHRSDYIIVILGSDESQMSDYKVLVEVFSPLKYSVLVSIPTSSTTEVLVNKIIMILSDVIMKGGKIIFYNFGGSSVKFFRDLMLVLLHQKKKFMGIISSVRAIIWDSAPSGNSVKVRSKVMVRKVFGDRDYHALLSPLCYCYYSVLKYVCLDDFRFDSYHSELVGILTGILKKCFQLYIYSITDEISDVQKNVREFIRKQKKFDNQNITEKRFYDTAHLSHFKERRSEYITALNNFLRRTLGIKVKLKRDLDIPY